MKKRQNSKKVKGCRNKCSVLASRVAFIISKLDSIKNVSIGKEKPAGGNGGDYVKFDQVIGDRLLLLVKQEKVINQIRVHVASSKKAKQVIEEALQAQKIQILSS